MENLIISDQRTKEDLAVRLVKDIYFAGFHGYLTVVNPVADRFEEIDVDLFLGYDTNGFIEATIEVVETEERFHLFVSDDETTVELLTRVRDAVLRSTMIAPDVEIRCGDLLARLKG